ncbi:MAG: MaoC family dehydratase [Aestuariivirgaceae bacterium]
MTASEPELFFEDFPVGQVVEYGDYAVTAQEIVSFAREFDPQPFHVDEKAAEASMLGRLCASGWHVCAIMMRMMVDGYFGRTASMGSTGLDEVKWLKPVFPGDRLSCRRTTLAARVSGKRPEMGIVTLRWELFDAKAEKKAEMVGINLIKVRDRA